jgi:hypothetical protein
MAFAATSGEGEAARMQTHGILGIHEGIAIAPEQLGDSDQKSSYTMSINGPKSLVADAQGLICGAWAKSGLCASRAYVRRHCSKTCASVKSASGTNTLVKVGLSSSQMAAGAGPLPRLDHDHELSLAYPPLFMHPLPLAGGNQYTLPIGTVEPGTKCKFPFTYNGKSYNTCIGKGATPPFQQSVNFLGQTLPYGWCSTTSKWQGQWGECGELLPRTCHLCERLHVSADSLPLCPARWLRPGPHELPQVRHEVQ